MWGFGYTECHYTASLDANEYSIASQWDKNSHNDDDCDLGCVYIDRYDFSSAAHDLLVEDYLLHEGFVLALTEQRGHCWCCTAGSKFSGGSGWTRYGLNGPLIGS